MIHVLEHPRGPNNAPAIVKRCIRFARRLRERDIHDTYFPSFVDDTRDSATVLVGNRVVQIHDDGTCTQQLKPVRIGTVWRFDRQGMPAFRARSHARFLQGAAIDRSRGWALSARAMIAIATHDRKHYSLESLG